MPAPLPNRPARIIVADDHDWIRTVLVELIIHTLPRSEVIAFPDGERALEAYVEGGADFVVSNHSMPKINGATLIRALRKLQPRLPILMVSANPDVKAEAREVGASWFVHKGDLGNHLPPLLRTYAGTGRLPDPGFTELNDRPW